MIVADLLRKITLIDGLDNPNDPTDARLWATTPVLVRVDGQLRQIHSVDLEQYDALPLPGRHSYAIRAIVVTLTEPARAPTTVVDGGKRSGSVAERE